MFFPKKYTSTITKANYCSEAAGVHSANQRKITQHRSLCLWQLVCSVDWKDEKNWPRCLWSIRVRSTQCLWLFGMQLGPCTAASRSPAEIFSCSKVITHQLALHWILMQSARARPLNRLHTPFREQCRAWFIARKQNPIHAQSSAVTHNLLLGSQRSSLSLYLRPQIDVLGYREWSLMFLSFPRCFSARRCCKEWLFEFHVSSALSLAFLLWPLNYKVFQIVFVSNLETVSISEVLKPVNNHALVKEITVSAVLIFDVNVN